MSIFTVDQWRSHVMVSGRNQKPLIELTARGSGSSDQSGQL